MLLGVIVMVADAVPGIELAGISDLAIAGRKFSGNAQQRKRRFLLHHGTLLYAFDLTPVGRFLRLPPRQPEYRAGRDHTTFLRNLPLAVTDLKERLREVWEAKARLEQWPAGFVSHLVRDKYATSEWNRRR